MALRLMRSVTLGVITVFGVVVLTFVLQYVLPGDAARSIAGPRATPEVLEQIRLQLGLNEPLIVQFGQYMANVFTGNFGESYSFQQPVLGLILDRLPATLMLAAAAFSIQIVLGFLWGSWEALRGKRSFLLSAVNVGLLSVPPFALGFVLLLIFGYMWGVAPIEGGAGWPHLILPALTLGLVSTPYYATAVRDGMTESLSSPYLRTAVSKGMPRTQILRRHVIRNILSPVVSLAGMDIALFLSGVVFVEQIFAWPGLGQMQVLAFEEMDRPLLMGTIIVAAVLVVIASMLADGIRAVIDPRARATG